MTELPTLIAAVDVAVVDPDLLWRVEHMNLLRSVVAREFADPVEALDSLTPGHGAAIVLGPGASAEQRATLEQARRERPELRIVVCAGAADADDPYALREGPWDDVLPWLVNDDLFGTRVAEVVIAARHAGETTPVVPARAGASVTAPEEPTAAAAAPTAAAAAPTGNARADERVIEPVAPIVHKKGTPAPTKAPAPAPAPPAPAPEPALAPTPLPATPVRVPKRKAPDFVSRAATSGLRPYPPRLIVLTSAKGGEGVSTFAVNLAEAFTWVPDTTVALVDAEPLFGDLTIDLGGEALAVPEVASLPIEADVAASLVDGVDEGALTVVRRPAAIGAAADNEGDLLQDLFGIAGEHADVVIADVPFEALIESGCVEHASLVVLVTSRRVASVKNAAIAVRGLGSAEHVGLVVNELDRRERVMSVDEIARFVGAPLLGHLPFSPSLRRAASRIPPNEIAAAHSRYHHAMTHVRRAIASHLPI